jgi:hypothetical protein
MSGKKLARQKREKTRTVTKSVADPDRGLLVKGSRKRQFAYVAHTACDANGFVPEAVVTPGNVHDSIAFDDIYDKMTASFPKIETVVMDSACKEPHICKEVFDDGRILYSLQAPDDDEERTRIKSDPRICTNCPTRCLCTPSRNCVKTVQRHIWKNYEELADDAHTVAFMKGAEKPLSEPLRMPGKNTPASLM